MKRVLEILARINCVCLDKAFEVRASYDNKYTLTLPNGDKKGRVYLQATYISSCSKTGEELEWKGRKNYLSDHMTDDEIIKTAYVTFKQAVEHEVMEGFKVDNITLFNPHINYQTLLKVSNEEVTREPPSILKKV